METKMENPQLSAMLSIRNFDKAIEMHYEQLKAIESQLLTINKNALSIIESNCTTKDIAHWNATQQTCTDAIVLINKLVLRLQQKMESKDRMDLSEIWTTFLVLENTLKQSFVAAEKLGYKLLPKSAHQQWEKEVCNFEDAVLPLMIAHIDACKMELKLIEKYTPIEIGDVTHIVTNHIPKDFTFEEAYKYEQNYLKALSEIKKEFSKKKNSWDRFLHLLTSVTHQQPSERMIMQRWVNGEK